MEKSIITEQEFKAEVIRIRSLQAKDMLVRWVFGLLFAGGAYLLFVASPDVTSIPFSKLTLKDIFTGILFGLGVWILLVIAWLLCFNGNNESSKEDVLRAEAKRNIRAERGEVSLDV